MPTGYTAGIIDGTYKTFEQFAKQCVRAFGAAIHLRDDDLSVQWKPQVPSDYHEGQIKRINGELHKTSIMTKEEIMIDEKKRLEDERTRYMNRQVEELQNEIVLKGFLEKAKAFIPPTTEHQGIKDFMIQQITETIKFDCTDSWTSKRLEEISKELNNLDAELIRESRMSKLYKERSYHQEESYKEIARCKSANKWVEDYFKALDQWESI